MLETHNRDTKNEDNKSHCRAIIFDFEKKQKQNTALHAIYLFILGIITTLKDFESLE